MLVFGVSSKTPTILATCACPAFSSTPYGQPLGVNSLSRCSFCLYVSLFSVQITAAERCGLFHPLRLIYE